MTGALHCPRCGDPLVAAGQAFACGRDCGEWIDIAALPAVPLVRDSPGSRLDPTASDAREPRLPCARCNQAMEPSDWGTVAFDRCSHGVWLEGVSRSRFRAQLDAAVETEREIARLQATLEDPAGRRELASRLIALERRCERLERELARIDQRLTKARLDRWDIP